MDICRTIPEFRERLAALRAEGHSIGLVTTMGALHEGHLTLMRRAQAENDKVAATIFVNPTQFSEMADLAHYPSDEMRDISLLKAEGIAVLFMPEVSTMYPEGDETIVETTHLANVFHGLVRPGHFRGVATVVAKLFNIAQPDAAYFGEKDYQQLAVIRRMVRDLHFPLRIVGVPTVREEDGLAMSSRNLRLTPEDRAEAPILNAALDAAEELVTAGTTAEEVARTINRVIEASPRATLRGLDIVDAETFAPAEGPVARKIGIMISAEFGEILLIDQREITP